MKSLNRKAGNRLVLLLFIISCCSNTFSQKAAGVTINGTVSTGKGNPLADVTLSLQKRSGGNKLLQTVSEEQGRFSFTGIDTGTYILHASLVGYQTKTGDTLIINAWEDTITRHVIMTLKNESLKEVIVQSKKQRIEVDKGNIVLNVQNSALTTGSSAFDLLKQIPGVSIGQDDEILLRGTTGINVMIDGKMTYLPGKQLGLMLKGMNAEDISKIGLSNAPSSAFDAAGNAGIINITTKKRMANGYAIDLRSAITKGRYWMVNENITASLRTGKLNMYGSLDFNTPNRVMTSKSGNTIMENGQRLSMQRFNESTYKIKYYTYRIGADWQFLPGHQLALHYNGYFDDFTSTNYSNQFKYLSSGSLHAISRSLNALTEPYHYDAVNAGYRFDIDTSGKQFTADAHYISYRNLSDGLLESRDYDADNNPTGWETFLRSHQPGFVKIRSVKTDIVLPYRHFSIKAGLKYAVVTNDNKYRFDILDAGEYVEVEDMSNHFKYREAIAAAYLSLQKKFGKTYIDAGIRYEYTDADGYTVKQDVANKWAYGRLFPTLSVDQELNNNNKINLSVSRRINRPAYADLNPVRWYVDQYFYYSGNPELVPEMAWIFSVSNTFMRKYVITATYNTRSNYITRRLVPDAATIKSQSANFRSMRRLDLLLSAPFTITPSWNMQLTTAVSYTSYPVAQTSGFKTLSQWSGNLQCQQQVKLPAGIQLELAAYLFSHELWGIYKRSGIFYADGGIKKNFMKDNLSLQFTFSDFLRTNRYKGVSQSDVTDYHYNDRPDTHRFGLSVRYHIGGKLLKAQSRQIEEQNRL